MVGVNKIEDWRALSLCLRDFRAPILRSKVVRPLCLPLWDDVDTLFLAAGKNILNQVVDGLLWIGNIDDVLCKSRAVDNETQFGPYSAFAVTHWKNVHQKSGRMAI